MKGKIEIKFDFKIKTTRGFLHYVKFKRNILDNELEESENEEKQEGNEQKKILSNLKQPKTRFRRTIKKPATIYPFIKACDDVSENCIMHDYAAKIQKINLIKNDLELLLRGINLLLAYEKSFLGAGLGGGFENTSELRFVKFKNAINGLDKKKQKK